MLSQGAHEFLCERELCFKKWSQLFWALKRGMDRATLFGSDLVSMTAYNDVTQTFLREEGRVYGNAESLGVKLLKSMRPPLWQEKSIYQLSGASPGWKHYILHHYLSFVVVTKSCRHLRANWRQWESWAGVWNRQGFRSFPKVVRNIILPRLV